MNSGRCERCGSGNGPIGIDVGHDAFHRAMINGVGVFYREADPMAHPDAVDTFMSLTTTEQRHTGGMSHPERYNPDT
jgi:hypothetical protein